MVSISSSVISGVTCIQRISSNQNVLTQIPVSIRSRNALAPVVKCALGMALVQLSHHGIYLLFCCLLSHLDVRDIDMVFMS